MWPHHKRSNSRKVGRIILFFFLRQLYGNKFFSYFLNWKYSQFNNEIHTFHSNIFCEVSRLLLAFYVWKPHLRRKICRMSFFGIPFMISVIQTFPVNIYLPYLCLARSYVVSTFVFQFQLRTNCPVDSTLFCCNIPFIISNMHIHICYIHIPSRRRWVLTSMFVEFLENIIDSPWTFVREVNYFCFYFLGSFHLIFNFYVVYT